MGGSGCIHLPTNHHIEQSGGDATGFPVQENHSDCSGVAQHALVLGPSGHVQSGPTEPAQPAQSVDASLRQWQQELRLLRGDQPDQSMQQSGPFLQSGASLIRWTSGRPL